MAYFIYPRGARSRKGSSFYKLLSSLLIASFLLPASVFAQVAESSTSEGSTQPATSSTPGDTVNGSTQNTQAATPPADPQNGTLTDQASPTATGAVTKDKGDKGKPVPGDETDGTFSILSGGDTVYDYGREPVGSRLSPGPSLDLSGAFRYSYPLTVPPGRKGLEPKLSLEYSNQSSENQSVFGYGWSDNIPYIQRINKAGSEKLYSRYDFVSSLDGELFPTAAGTTTSFSAKADTGDFRTYTFLNNGWTVTDKQGTTYKFGTSTGSRQDDTASTTRIFKWMLDEIRDTKWEILRFITDRCIICLTFIDCQSSFVEACATKIEDRV
jgi:virulence plasmid B protein